MCVRAWLEEGRCPNGAPPDRSREPVEAGILLTASDLPACRAGTSRRFMLSIRL